MLQITIDLPQEQYAQFLGLMQRATFPFKITKAEMESTKEIHQGLTKSQSVAIYTAELSLLMAGKLSPYAVLSMPKNSESEE